MLQEVVDYLHSLQDTICNALEGEDGRAKFLADPWQHASGKGVSRIMEQGASFEKAGVNFSHIQGDKLPPAATEARRELAGQSFEVCGLSLVIHPHNPYVPITHMNLRFFISGGNSPVWWFGGGYDLTPIYGFEEDCVHWHKTAQAACQPFGETLYAQYKKACDDYFYLPHRHEPRGIGGLFFDDVNTPDFAHCFALVQSVGDSFIHAYLPIVQRRKDTPWGESQKRFQCIRRGRYAEFNLIWDRGTRFGLQSAGRIKSILMSLPPVVHWEYDYQPAENSPEAKLISYYLKPRDWI